MEEKQANRDAEKISKMGNLAGQFTSSFDDILSDIKTRTYEEQEEIYTGFIKLIEQRCLLIARRDLAAKLKDSMRKPVVSTDTRDEKPSLRGEKQKQLESTTRDPQLPDIIAATTSVPEDESKTKPQIITAAERESPRQITSTTNTGSRIKKQKVNRSGPTTTSAKTKSSKTKKNNR
jgi:hypothetical protein